MEGEGLRLIRKGNRIRLIAGQRSLVTNYGLKDGIVVALDPSQRMTGEVSFEIEQGKGSVSGSGTLVELGDPALHHAERGALAYHAPDVLPLLKRGWVLARLVPERVMVKLGGRQMEEEVKPAELNAPQRLRYLKALKPWTFQQTAASAVIATLLAPSVNYYLFAVSVVVLLLAHSAFNMMNDYFDYTSSLDRPNGMGSMGSRVLVDRLIGLRAYRIYMASFLLASLAGGLYLVYLRPVVWPYFAIGLAAGSLYSVPRVGWRWIALGDLAIFMTWGPGIFLGSYALQGGSIGIPVILIAVALGMLVLAIAHVNNWRDMADERAAGVVSIASILGDRASLLYYTVMIWGSYALFAAAVLIEPRLLPILGSLLTVPWALRLTKATRDSTDPLRDKLDMETAKFTALHMYFTVAFVLAFRLAPYLVAA